MNYIVIDDNNDFAVALIKSLGSGKIVPLNSMSPRTIAENLCKNTGDVYSINEFKPQHRRIEWNTSSQNETIILINAEGLYGTNDRTEQPGVEIFIWLRCLHYIVNPVIIYGFQDTASVLRNNPEHLIIHSDGCHYMRLPFMSAEVSKIPYNGLQNPSSISRHLAAAFNMEAFRHVFANKWGVGRLRAAINFTNSNNEKHDHVIDSKEIMIAKFLYMDKYKNEIFDQSLLKTTIKALKAYHSFLVKKRILYIDDQAESGWSQVLQDALNVSEENFRFYYDFTHNLQDDTNSVLGIIQDFQPDCVLLDLRLRPADDSLQHGTQYSGAVIAEKIKSNYVSLPVIMFTASNKAENLRTALRTGCETLWTKEGLDEYRGINNSLLNYFRLVKAVYDACKKFETDETRTSFETDKLLGELEKRMHRINYSILKNNVPEIGLFEQFKWIVTDTNFFIQDNVEKRTRSICNLYILLYSCKCFFKNKFYFDDEVFLELLRFSKMPKGNKRDEIIECSRYITNKIYQWNNQKLIMFNNPDVENFGKKLRNYSDVDFVKNENVPDDLNTLHSSWLEQMFFFITSKRESVVKSQTNVDEEYQSSRYKSDVNADISLVNVIRKFVSSNQSVLFISNDNGCAYQAGDALEKTGLTVTESSHIYVNEFEKKLRVPKIIADSYGNVVYRRMCLGEVHSILSTVRDNILKIDTME